MPYDSELQRRTMARQMEARNRLGSAWLLHPSNDQRSQLREKIHAMVASDRLYAVKVECEKLLESIVMQNEERSTWREKIQRGYDLEQRRRRQAAQLMGGR